MSDHTAIQWTDATWNPTTGCTKISPGCAHCYIDTTPAFRIRHRQFDAKGHIPLELHDNRLTQPMRWREPRRIFVNSLSDLFHRDISYTFIDQVFAVMALTPQHTYQVLTKRAPRMCEYLADDDLADRIDDAAGEYGACHANVDDRWPLPNVWLGVSVENQRLTRRIDYLLETPAAVRFVSAEPLLEDLDLTPYLIGDALAAPGPGGFRKGPRLDWVIVGGESGPHARPFDVAWARAIVKDCRDASVPCFVKQLGSRPGRYFDADGDTVWNRIGAHGLRHKKGGDPDEWPADLRVREFPAIA